MKKVLEGVVRSAKMTNTASVTVTHLKSHPIYGKKTKVTKAFLADNKIGAKEGDNVVMESSKPLSKNKHFVITKIVKA